LSLPPPSRSTSRRSLIVNPNGMLLLCLKTTRRNR
jgi:hypothetical protein